MKTIVVDPVTRLQGQGRISLFLNDSGQVANAYLQIPELRGFEELCRGRHVGEMPGITARICGVCPVAHHLAAAKALDHLYGVEPPPTAKKLRELLLCASCVADHTTHFYALGGPDLLVGPDAPRTDRNLLGVIAKIGLELGKTVINQRLRCQKVIAMIAGRALHPIAAVAGGMSKSLSEEERTEIAQIARDSVEFARASLRLFDRTVALNPAYLNLAMDEAFTARTYYLGLVDARNRMNLYEGALRVVDPDGNELLTFDAADYLKHISEHVEPWTFLKFPYLDIIGWQGLVDGYDSGMYRVGPLARLNVSDGMPTPLAQEEYERLYSALKGKPTHSILAMHWARLIELLYASERMVELADDRELTDPHVRVLPSGITREGVGVVEAPRGTLLHHYRTDENGIVRQANFIVGTGNNYPAICLSIKKAAQGLIKNGNVDESIVNRIELACRAYDPCLGCATHAQSGESGAEILVYDATGELTAVAHRC